MLLRMIDFFSFSWLNNIPLCIYTHTHTKYSLSFYLPQVASTAWLLKEQTAISVRSCFLPRSCEPRVREGRVFRGKFGPWGQEEEEGRLVTGHSMASSASAPGLTISPLTNCLLLLPRFTYFQPSAGQGSAQVESG